MSEESRSWTAAPAEVAVEIRLDGYVTTLTLRGDAGSEVLPKLKAALEWLTKHGAEPTTAEAGNGTGPGADEAADPHVCPIHHVRMVRREKHGDVWWSHKAIDPETGAEYWCRGGDG